MVIQPHIENAIWHGLMHKEDSCQLSITMIKLDDQTIQVIIEDNGVGRTKAEEMKSKQTLKNKSFGSQISQDRIKYFSELTGKVAELKIEDLYHEDGSSAGTKVILTLPTKNHA
jgi:sensor histidine kinase YesM